MDDMKKKREKMDPYPPEKMRKARKLSTVSVVLGVVSGLCVLLFWMVHQSFMEDLGLIDVLRMVALVLMLLFPFSFVGGVVCGAIAAVKYYKTVYPIVIVALYVMSVVFTVYALFAFIVQEVLNEAYWTVYSVIDCINHPPV